MEIEISAKSLLFWEEDLILSIADLRINTYQQIKNYLSKVT